jgi:hypothetical protein
VEQVKVDPATLRRAGEELARLAAAVHSSRAGAASQVAALRGRLGQLAPSVGEQWSAAGVALDRVESDFREIGRALEQLATYFAELDRGAVPR